MMAYTGIDVKKALHGVLNFYDTEKGQLLTWISFFLYFEIHIHRLLYGVSKSILVAPRITSFLFLFFLQKVQA